LQSSLFDSIVAYAAARHVMRELRSAASHCGAPAGPIHPGLDALPAVVRLAWQDILQLLLNRRMLLLWTLGSLSCKECFAPRAMPSTSENPRPDERSTLSGHCVSVALARCTGFAFPVDALMRPNFHVWTAFPTSNALSHFALRGIAFT
jgi:hypothetical protein